VKKPTCDITLTNTQAKELLTIVSGLVSETKKQSLELSRKLKLATELQEYKAVDDEYCEIQERRKTLVELKQLALYAAYSTDSMPDITIEDIIHENCQEIVD